MTTTSLLLLALSLAPQGPDVLEAPAPPVATPLDRALDTITAAEIEADLTFIASDAMAGRDSPSPQLEIAARFIRARLMRLGFEPGAQDGSYFHEWQIHKIGLDPDRTHAKLSIEGGATIDLDWRRGYYFADWQSLGMRDATGEVVFGGDLSPEVLAGMEVEGLWVLDAGIGKGLSGRRKSELQERGALGVIALPRDNADQTVADAFARRNEAFTRTRLSWQPRTSNGFPLIHLTEDIVERTGIRARLGDLAVGEPIGWDFAETCTSGDLGPVTLENVVGIWPGSDPVLKNEVIILSAHYDHVGVNVEGEIFNGADDNGSGTSGLLAIAEALEAYGPMRRSIMLMWVSAEEKGLLGSEAWTKDPYLPGDLMPLCNINIDMIGRNASDEFLITPTSEHPAYSALTQVAEANAKKEGFTKIKSADSYWQRSDHYNFERHMKLPVAFLFCDVHADYHQPTDTVEKIDFDKMRRICRLVVRMLEALQIDEPKF